MVTIDARGAKWLALALLVSLALNLFAGGILAGQWASGRGRPPVEAMRGGPPAGPQEPDRAALGPIARVIAAAPPEHRAALEDAILAQRRALVAANQALRQARLAARDAFVVDPFDRAAAARALAEVRRRSEEVQRIAQEAILDGAERLPADARRQMAVPTAGGPVPAPPPRPGRPRDLPPREGRP